MSSHADRMKPILVAAVDAAIKHGFTLTPGCTLDARTKKCCPLGAHAMANASGATTFARWSTGFKLPKSWAADFASGFDECCDDIKNEDAYALGQWFRATYVK